MTKRAVLASGEEIHFPDSTPDHVVDGAVAMHHAASSSADLKNVLPAMAMLLQSHQLHNDMAVHKINQDASVPQDLTRAVQVLAQMAAQMKMTMGVLIEVSKNLQLGFSNLSGTITDATLHMTKLHGAGKKVVTDEKGNITGIMPNTGE